MNHKSIEEVLTEKDLQSLQDQHYEILEWVGEGQTRDVFKARYQHNGLVKTLAVKITKPKINENSICTVINQSKFPRNNININEIECANELEDHPNIATIRDVIIINNKYCTVEDYIDGETLEDFVNKNGPLKKDQFLAIFSGVTAGISYLHHMHTPGHFFDPLIHRDIKPSNIIIDKNLRIKITDLQNAKRESKIRDQLLPTRGGTNYTSPKILNALVSMQESSCNIKTDMYAIGASMYFALTGKVPFSYDVTYDDNGSAIKLPDREIKVSLTNNNKKIKSISLEEHEHNLEKALKAAPSEYRKVIRKCMSFKKDIYYNTTDLAYDLERIDRKKNFKETLKRIRKPASFMLSAIASLAAVIALQPNTKFVNDHSPTLRELLDTKRYLSHNLILGNTATPSPLGLLDDMKGYVQELRHQMTRSDVQDVLADIHMASRTFFVEEPKDFTAIILAAYLGRNDGTRRAYANHLSKTLVPKPFIYVMSKADVMSAVDDRMSGIESSTLQSIGAALNYYVAQSSSDDRLEDTFVKYFCTSEDIATAKERAKSTRYFPISITEVGPSIKADHITEKVVSQTVEGYVNGYRFYLPSEKRELVDRAIAFYFALNDDGTVKSVDASEKQQSPSLAAYAHDSTHAAMPASSTRDSFIAKN